MSDRMSRVYYYTLKAMAADSQYTAGVQLLPSKSEDWVIYTALPPKKNEMKIWGIKRKKNKLNSVDV